MFKSRDDSVISPAFGRAAPAALLTAQFILTKQPAPRPLPSLRKPDLAQDIGSQRWWRDLAGFAALTAIAAALWPGIAPLVAAPPVSFDANARDETRSQLIAPLALGGDSGRHMASGTAVRILRTAPRRAQLALSTKIAPGEGLDDALRRAGLNSGDASRALSLVGGALNPSQLAPGTEVDIRLGPEANGGRQLDAVRFRARFDLALAVERRGGTLALTRTGIAVSAAPLRIRGTVGPSLYRSARAAGAPASAVQAYLQVLGQQVDLEHGLLPTDTFDIVVAHRRAATGESKLGQLLYAGIDRDARPRIQLLRWGGQFYEASGVGEQRSGLVAPVPGRVTSHFGQRRHPVLGFVRMHAGLDFGAASGTPVVAVTDGRVTSAGRMGGCGIAVRIDHGNALQTRYCHMSRMAAYPGQLVRRGEVIGYVGSTGLSTGPHLHYEMYRGGRPVNPAEVSFVTRAQLAGNDLVRFRQALQVLKRITPGAALAPLANNAPSDSRAMTRREIDKVGG
ncbi:M23 family metallopeptidase [Qipengyuania sediminis]|uniref:M23 family metallopeptidase n=1 Tax=Qipengyuania sediminis TaxID=1532023 RepID=UPI00105924DA|nr:M23 family metallopeptidase [Qipengyuania sediminis]